MHMRNKTQISDLVKKFQDKKISPEELSLLYTTLKQSSNEIDTLITNEWEKVSSESAEVDAAKILQSIHKKAQFTSSAIDKPSKQINSDTNTRLFQFMRYAAIFIVAFSIAWFMRSPKKLVESSNTTNVAVAYGSKSTIELPDGSVVVLNSGSKLTYPTSFGKDNRTVFLSGEGFFEVRRNSKWPFFVKTRGVTIRVTGTKFNVKAYPDETLTETTLVSGSVEILENKKESTPKLLAILKPNQKAVFSCGILEIEKSAKNLNKLENINKPDSCATQAKIDVEKGVKTEELICWKNNVLVFNNEKLTDLTKKLERWYNVDISLKNNALANIRFSGKFDKESIQELLDALILIQPFAYEINKNKIVIK
jgi:transmembrane sensor